MNQGKTGMFIAELRKAKGYTQLQLARLLNISDRTVSKWEREFPRKVLQRYRRKTS